MGGWNGPILNENSGIPQDLAARARRGGYDLGGPMRNRGLIQALTQIAQPAQPAGTDRVQDDPVTRANPEAYGATTPAQSPMSASPTNPLTEKMWEEYNKLGQPEPAAPQPSLKQRLLSGLLRAAPIAAGAIAAGGYGARGAAQGTVQEMQREQGINLAQRQMAQQHEQQRNSLRERMLQEILQQQRMEQQNQQFNERESQRDRLAQQAQQGQEQRLGEKIAAGQQAQEERERAAQTATQSKEDFQRQEQQRQFDQQTAQQQRQFGQQMAMQGRQFGEQEKLIGMRQNAEKVTADEQRRADLANNMSENLNQLEDILKRRPELFGPAAGRMTQLRQFVGTGDPDVAKLKAIREYLGMASVGAHAMRNAQHVGAAADAVMAGFTNSPQATLAAVKTARDSIATFQADAQRGKGGAASAGGPKPGTVEDGYRFKGGDPANQANWEKVK